MNISGESFLTLEGELTIRTAAQMHEQLQNALEEGHYRLDLSRVEAMDSAGFQLLVSADASLRKAGLNLQICAASDPVRDLLGLYGFSRLLDASAAQS